MFTPFKDGKVDVDALVGTTKRQVEAGIDFLVPLGTTGETPTLSDEEKLLVFNTVKAHAAGKPVVVGVGTNSLAGTRANMELLKEADAFLVVVPYYNKPPQRGIYAYFKAVAESTDKPIILYNVPGRTGANCEAATTLALARDVENIVAVKEASGNLEQIKTIIEGAPEGFRAGGGQAGPLLRQRRRDPFRHADGRCGRGVRSLQRGSPGDGHLRARRTDGRLGERRRPEPPAPPAVQEPLHRAQPHPRKGRHGPAGSHGEFPAAAAGPCDRRHRGPDERNPGSIMEITLQDFNEVIEALEKGELRVAQKVDGVWQVNRHVKEVILAGFKLGAIRDMSEGQFSFLDKDTYPVRKFSEADGVRIVPGGSSIRRGAYLAKGTIVMPPSYINVGAFVDEGTMVDSHVTIGSCAQIGKRIHISAATQIGGVLEPAGALPTIIEDGAFVGGNCGIYEGTIVEEGAVIASGVIITASTAIFDATKGSFVPRNADGRVVVPRGAVVVSGSKPILRDGKPLESGVQLYCPVIVKYRDEKTAGSVHLEDLLR